MAVPLETETPGALGARPGKRDLIVVAKAHAFANQCVEAECRSALVAAGPRFQPRLTFGCFDAKVKAQKPQASC